MTRACAACLTVLAVGAWPAPAGAETPRPYVVVYDTPAGAAYPVQAETAARERRYGFESERRFRHALDGFAARLTGSEVRALRADPEVAVVEPDRELRAARVALAPGESVPTGVERIGAAGAAGVHAPSASAVAVLDTGIDPAHPDLAAYAGANCVGPGNPEDDNGHGTFVAGVIGARNDGAGVVGVAPGTALYAVKVLGADGVGLVSQVICGVEWVTANARRLGIRVANMSLSYPVQSDALHIAVQSSVSGGTVYTVAAGNNALDIAQEIPGAYPEVLTVTAMADSNGTGGGGGPPFSCAGSETDDRFYTRSNFAVRPADAAHVVAAPGVCIESTALGGGEETGTGTSAAAPHVAGVVAVCMGEAGRPGPCADMTPAEVIEQVRADAAANATPQQGFGGDPLSPVGPYFGHLVSGVDPTVRRIAARAPPAGPAAAQTPALDKALQVLALRIRRRQDVDDLSVLVRLAEAGTASARARLQLPGGAARVIFSRPASAPVEANRARRLRLRLRRAALRRVKRALRRGTRVRARVTVTVSDPAGNTRSKTARVRLRP